MKFAVPGTHKRESVEWLTEWDKRTTLESAKVDGDRATAIVTVRRHEHWLRRARYVVSKVNGELRISDLRYFCIICRGSGISARGGVCDICEGEGYFASPELNRVASQDESQSTHLRGETPSPEELDQFMHEFLGANRQLYGQLAEWEKSFWAGFALPGIVQLPHDRMHADWQNVAQIESFKLGDTHATVVATVVRAYQALTCFRYTLTEINSAWWINDVELECHLCLRKGVLDASEGTEAKEWVCPLCHGKGWFRPQTEPET